MLVAGALYNHYMGHSALLVELIMVAAGCVLAIYSTKMLAVPEDERAHGLFVVIWRTYYIVTGESHYEITAYAEFYFVTLPVVTLLDLLGFHVTAILELDGVGLANIIEYVHDDRLLRLGIGVGCSGLYSAGLFFSAFLAFVLTRYRKLDANIGIGLGIGLLVTWASNIIRMTITIMVGIAYGHPALAFVHGYIGILIFVACITVFC